MRVETRKGITVYAFAKSVGVSKQTVSEAVAKGRIPRSALFDDGSLDEVAARVAFLSTSQPQRHKHNPQRKTPRLVEDADETAEGLGDLDAVEIARLKVDRLVVELRLKEHELKTLEGSTIPKDEARRAVRDWATKIKVGLLNFASRRGPGIAAALGVDEVALVGRLEAAMREHMNEMADEPLPLDIEGKPSE